MSATASTTTAPLTPPDADLQDFPFMPLHVARLRDSDLAAEENPEACWYAVMLWSASWHQLPAGSLPDNETVLTRLCGLGRDIKTFRKHRAGAMRGFVLCSDGRWYHPVVAEQVVAAWEQKLQQRWRTECARIKKQNQRTGGDLPAPTYEEFLASLSPGTPMTRDPNVPDKSPGTAENVPGDKSDCPSGHRVQETGTGTGTGNNSSEAKASATVASIPVDDPAKAAWDLAVRLLVERGGKSESAARSLFGKLLRDNALDARDMLGPAASALSSGTADPFGYLTKAAQGVARRRAQQAEPARVGFV